MGGGDETVAAAVRAPGGGAERVPALTGVRFLAAALVFAGHLFWLDRDHPPPLGHDLPLLGHQATGVGLFFCLSGVVIAWTYGRRFVDHGVTARGFLWRRFARLYPMYAVAVVSAVPWGIHAGDPPRWLVVQLLGLGAWVPDTEAYYGWHGAVWSVSAELFFYLTFPLLAVALLPRLRTPSRAVGLWLSGWAVLVVAYAVGRATRTSGTAFPLYIFPPTRAVEFVLGVLVGWSAANGWFHDLAVRCRWVPLVLAVSTLVVHGPSRWPLAYVLWFVPMFSVVLLVLASGLGPKLLGHPWAERLGEASYSFYLVHFQVLLVVGIGLRTVGAGPDVLVLVGAPLALVATTLLSIACYRFVEVPAKDRLLRWGPR